MLERSALLDQIIEYATDKRWETLSIDDIARGIDVAPSKLRACFPHKTLILQGILMQARDQFLFDLDKDLCHEAVRDRLLESMLTFYETMVDRKNFLAGVFSEISLNQLLEMTTLLPTWFVCARSIMEVSGVSTLGLKGNAQTSVMMGGIIKVFYGWLKDDSPGFELTMKQADKWLNDMQDNPFSRF
jgi:AcrR family transcriptional regulator